MVFPHCVVTSQSPSPPSPTVYFPVEERKYQTAPDRLTALKVYGSATTLPLLATSVLGRSKACDLRVQRQYLANEHVRLDLIESPRGARASVRVTNISKKNDVVYHGAIALDQFCLEAGEWFVIGESRYYVLNEEMQSALPYLYHFLGMKNHELVDELMIAAIRDSSRPIVLTGEPRCGQVDIARIIHGISHRREQMFHPLAADATLDATTRQVLAGASGGTVFVPLHSRGSLHPPLASALVRPSARVRLVISAASPDKVSYSFPSVMDDMKRLSIPSIAQRKDDMPELLNRMFVHENSPLRFSKLRSTLRRAVVAYTWPENVEELTSFASYLCRLEPVRAEESKRQVARDSHAPRSRQKTWEQRLGVEIELPLVPDE